MKYWTFRLINCLVIYTTVILTACNNQTQKNDKSIDNTEYELPKDSANWDFQLFEKHYSNSLIRVLKDSLKNHITYHECEIIDQQHIHLWLQDSCKAKKYVFLMAQAIRESKKPVAPIEFYPPLKLPNDSLKY